jgi:hypothetical protein
MATRSFGMQRFSTPEELAAEIGVGTNFIHVTIGLDKGCLAKSDTTLYFLGPRMGGWEVVESSPLVDVTRVEQKSNFMGETTLIVCKSGRWQCKDVEEGLDIAQWLSYSVPVFTNPSTVSKSTSTFDESPPPQESEIEETWESDDIVDVLKETPSEVLERFEPVTPPPSSNLSESTESELSGGDIFVPTEDDSEEAHGSSCVTTLVKWFVYLWIFGFVMDFCDSL